MWNMLNKLNVLAVVLTQDRPRPGFFDGVQGVAFLLGFLGIGLITWYTIHDLRRRNRKLKMERDELRAALESRDVRYREFYNSVDAVTRQKAVTALTSHKPLANPPGGVAPTLQRMLHQEPELSRDPLFFAVGWLEVQRRASVICFTFDGRSPYFCGNIAISGETRKGKGNLAFLICALICLRASTSQAQVFAIDPKRDFALWRGKAHNWREPVLGRDPAMLQAAMDALRTERERREQLRERHRVLVHEELPDAVRPPTLLVYIAELSVLGLATQDLDSWLAAEMSTALASGIVYIIDDQNNSNRTTAYRTHYGTFLAGCQSSQDSVKPNIGMGPEELRKLGAIPPHELPGPGYFTLRNGRDVYSFRTPLISLDDREAVLAHLPNSPRPLKITLPISAADAAATSAVDERRPKVVVTDEERGRILSEALKHSSRGDLTAAVFNGRRTGEAAQKVKLVCDEAGLLLPNTGREGARTAQPVEAA